MAYSARYNQSAKTYAVFSDSGGFVNIDDVVKMLNERDELLTLLKEIYHDVIQGAIPNHDDEWYERAREAIAKAEDK